MKATPTFHEIYLAQQTLARWSGRKEEHDLAEWVTMDADERQRDTEWAILWWGLGELPPQDVYDVANTTDPPVDPIRIAMGISRASRVMGWEIDAAMPRLRSELAGACCEILWPAEGDLEKGSGRADDG